MKTKKIPLRTCIVTKEVLPKQELLRVVINKAKNLKILDKKLEVEIDEKLYEDLINLIK